MLVEPSSSEESEVYLRVTDIGVSVAGERLGTWRGFCRRSPSSRLAFRSARNRLRVA